MQVNTGGQGVPTLFFTVDAALLRELGERLVGKPYIALAELVKNSYDADAYEVEILMNPNEDRIVLSDNGHGMTLKEFKDFWMRVGSIHKVKQRVSRKLGRPMTGSKGIGRLAVQYLAKELTLFTTPENDLNSRLVARVKWEEAVKSRDLTKASVEYRIERKAQGFKQGTKLFLTGLKHQWTTEDVKGLASEIWELQPPFRRPFGISKEVKTAFEVKLSSELRKYKKAFDEQMTAVLDVWRTRLVGKNDEGDVSLSIEYAGEEPIIENYSLENCALKNGDFEIRIYHWKYRKPRNIRVGKAREYFERFGGVHVYDGGFHLPYYGDPKNDWLKVEIDHSHRLTLSKLLPEEIQVPLGLQFLPTLTRIFGVVNVNTSTEPNLRIVITRDRLQETKALRDLSYIVRYALDLYALIEKKRSILKKDREKEIVKPKYQSVEEVLAKHKTDIPEKTYEVLQEEMKAVTKEIETKAENTAEKVSLTGPLATAGIASLASHHELRRQLRDIDDIIERLKAIKVEDKQLNEELQHLTEDLASWTERTKATNAIFSYFRDAKSIKVKERFLARKVVEQIQEQIRVLARGVPISVERLDADLLLPKASIVEWYAVFQNVLINAFNAMVDSEKKLIDVSSRREDNVHEILIQDTGCGVNLEDAEALFEPFERRLKISPERQALGYGGMGLGLTIVRLVANNIGCRVSFTKPEKEFSTAFSLRWREIE